MYNQAQNYQPVHEKPTAAFALSLVAGLFIILGGLIPAIFGGVWGGIIGMVPGMGGLGGMIALIGLLGLVWGVLVLVGAGMINSCDVGRVKTGGAIVLIFSIISWFGAFGGFFIGFLLGLIGGIMALAWHPSTPQYMPQQQPNYAPNYYQQPYAQPQPQPQPPVTRICPNCGQVLGENVRFCPHCGRQVG